MSIVETDTGQVAYEAYALASDGVSLVSGQPLPEWDEQDERIRQAWRDVYDAVILSAGVMTREDQDARPAKVFIVTEQRGQIVTERRYVADSFDADSSGLDIIRDGRVVAAYPGEQTWLSVREDGAEVPDATARALGIAKHALEAVVAVAKAGAGDITVTPEQIAAEALEEIFAETEL